MAQPARGWNGSADDEAILDFLFQIFDLAGPPMAIKNRQSEIENT
jgi:hypothetical protein